MAGEPLVELREATAAFPSGATVGPLSIGVRSGEFLLVAGPNGSGKTTLLHLVAGRLAPTAGTTRAPPRNHIAVLPQRHAFDTLVPIRVADVVAFGTIHSPADRRAKRLRVDEALAAVGIEALRHRLFRELSGGQRQLAQIARLLAQDAPLWLLDEPLSGLDLKWSRVVTDTIDRLHEQGGRTVIHVTHRLDRPPRRATRAILLDEGRILRDGRPADTLSESALRELFDTPDHAHLV